MLRLTFISLVAIFMPYEAMAQNPTRKVDEIILGRWCDRPIPKLSIADNVITIKVNNHRKPQLIKDFRGAKSEVAPLREKSGNVFMGGDHGEGYRIIPNTGDLQLFDQDGIIRVATRLEGTPRDGECFRR